MLDRIYSTSIHELVEKRVREAIHLGLYGPGDRLPPEQEMAQHLGVSRATVREAMLVLRAKGYVRSKRGAKGGWFITQPERSVDELRTLVQRSLPQLEQVLEFRIVIEKATATLAAGRRNPSHVQELEAAIQDLEASAGLADFRRADSRFHVGIADAAGNPLLQEAVAEARATFFILMDAMGFDVMLQSTISDHRAILGAIQVQDADEAGRLMARHINTTRSELHHILKTKEGNP